MVIKSIKNKYGVTLIELIVSISIFSVIMMFVLGIFQGVVEGQRSAIAAQTTQESMRYVFEIMAKEIRNAKGSHLGHTDCLLSPRYKVYNTNESGGIDLGDKLYFKNKNGECIIYELDNDRLRITRNDGAVDAFYITPDEVKVSDIKFFVYDDPVDEFKSIQPWVTIKMTVEMKVSKKFHSQRFNIQTTVAARYYE